MYSSLEWSKCPLIFTGLYSRFFSSIGLQGGRAVGKPSVSKNVDKATTPHQAERVRNKKGPVRIIRLQVVSLHRGDLSTSL